MTFEGLRTISECGTGFYRAKNDHFRFGEFPEGFPMISEGFPTPFRRCSEVVPKVPRGVLGRRRLFGAFREKRLLPVQGGSSVGCFVLFMQISVSGHVGEMLLSDWLAGI